MEITHRMLLNDMAVLMDAQVKRDRERKRQELENFKRRVRRRVVAWERTRQMQMAATTVEIVTSEQKIAEQAVKLDKVRVSILLIQFTKNLCYPLLQAQKSFEVGLDIEDIRTLASARDTAKLITQPGHLSASQLARNKLLALRGSGCKSGVGPEKKPSVQFAPSVQYEIVTKLSHEVQEWTTSSDHHQTLNEMQSRTVSGYHRSSETDRLKGESDKVKRFANPGHLELVKKKQAALQYLLFRRLYSDIEREQARQKHRQQTQAQKVEQLKKQKEATRRLVEDEVNTFDSSSTASSETTEDRERAREWTELMILEERKQRLQKSRESERYTEALKARLKEKLKTKDSALLPLCSCETTLWDADPSTCANNCPFYRNPKGV